MSNSIRHKRNWILHKKNDVDICLIHLHLSKIQFLLCLNGAEFHISEIQLDIRKIELHISVIKFYISKIEFFLCKNELHICLNELLLCKIN